MTNWEQKLTSRKFWLCVAAGCTGLGAGIAGINIGGANTKLAIVLVIAGGVLCAIGAGAYAIAEALVDKASVGSNTTSVTASTTSKDIVETALGTSITSDTKIGGSD